MAGKDASERGLSAVATVASKTCFVIGPIGTTDSPERIHADLFFKIVVEEALSPLGYVVSRADLISKPGNINTQLLGSIFTADLVVADLTFKNANAYYEMAARHHTGKPTIPMARHDEWPLPFDNSMQRTIPFDLANAAGILEARSRLISAANSTLATDYADDNPIVHTRHLEASRQSTDPEKQLIAELSDTQASLLERLANLEQTVYNAPPISNFASSPNSRLPQTDSGSTFVLPPLPASKAVLLEQEVIRTLRAWGDYAAQIDASMSAIHVSPRPSNSMRNEISNIINRYASF